MAALIEDYALLGNCKTAALVDKDGSLDWLCFPRFDSPACFAALLGNQDNGRWLMTPREAVRQRSRGYRAGTLILETTFETANGRAMLIDFMPMGSEHSSVVRIVAGLEGQVDFEMDLAIRFDYGSSVPWVEKPVPRTLVAVAGPEMLVLRSGAELHSRARSSGSEFTVRAQERHVFVLTHQPSNLPIRDGFDAEQALCETERFWCDFSDRCPEVGPWSELVKRSLITLKAMTYSPTGGIVAAVTTSLPERLGGERNWDYRYCWLRDATMTLLALMNLGYYEEANAWRDWLLRSVAGNPEQIQIMYGLGGERRLPEYELPWLSGYEESRPVRIGNAAADQLQIDVYGEVVDAMTQARKGGMSHHPRGAAISAVLQPYLEKVWRQPDEGLWEIRGEPQHFTHSKVMAWVAFDRWAKEAETDPTGQARALHCRSVADVIHREVCDRGVDPILGCFVQSYGSQHMDASLLHILLTGFLPPDDPRVLKTVEQIEQRLLRQGLLLRYDTSSTDDGLTPGEGTFLVCSFWLADAYVLMERFDDAHQLFQRLSGLCNDVGLLAEQFEPQSGRMLGNFPQAFSHLGIINTALNLHRAHRPVQARAQTR